MSKLIEQALKAQGLGYVYISTVVKQVYNTEYFHVVSIETVLRAGKWIPAPICQLNAQGARGRRGQIHVPDGTISRSALWAL